jgi:DNA repair exonuclease SbcCD nuclease subunit
MIRFLHTSDWQLGITRHFLSEGVQERFTQARFDAIRHLGRIAKEESCDFMVVCGDVFESNQVDRKTVSRALEALKEVPVPVYLLPGNHDPLNAGSVYRSSTFIKGTPSHVHIVEDMTPITLSEGLHIVGAPWTSKRPLTDLVAEMTGPLNPIPNVKRVCIAHGAVDSFSPNPEDPALISLAAAERALSEGKIHYIALGDRHSVTKVGNSNRIWYSSTPEPTDYNEQMPGFALIVEIDKDEVLTKELPVSTWRFIERERLDLNSQEELDTFRTWLNTLEDKERTILKIRFVGTLSLLLYAQLEAILANARELLGALEIRIDDLAIIPDDTDFSDLGFSGFTARTVERLRPTVTEAGPNSVAARDALALLIRLARKAE